MQFRPICAISKKNASFFCICDKCQQQPFLCKFCQGQECSKVHIHKPNTFIMSCPLQILKVPILNYEKILKNQLTIIQNLEERLIHLLDKIKQYITKKIYQIKKIQFLQINNTISQLNTEKFHLINGRKLSQLVRYMESISQIPNLDIQIKKKSSNLHSLMDNIEKCIKNSIQFEKTPESIPFFKFDHFNKKIDKVSNDKGDSNEKLVLKKTQDMKKKEKLKEKKSEKLKQKILYIDQRNNHEEKNLNKYQKVDQEQDKNLLKINNRKRWNDESNQQQNEVINQNQSQSNSKKSIKKNLISLFRYPKNQLENQENMNLNGISNQKNLIVNLQERILQEEQSY